MSTKHTPGPWRVKDTSEIVKGDTVLIADVYGQCDQREANATLMATAPEMLIELKNALDGFQILSGVLPTHKGIKNDILRLEAIIKKATNV